MAKKEQVPAIRFQGFADPWEQRKFNDVFSILQNCTLSRAELSYDNGEAFNIHYGDVLIKFGEVIDAETALLPRITDEKIVASFRSSALQDGDIVIADTAEDEAVGKCAEMLNLQEKTAISGLHTIPVRPTARFATGYLGYFMNSPAFHDQLLPLMQGTKVTSVSKSALQDTVISFPSERAEQGQIGRYFMALDTLITLHQCKYLMFPAFSQINKSLSDTLSWEQRKVGEVSKRVIVGLATSVTPYYREEGVPILRNLNIKENYLDDTDILFLDRPYAESQVSKQIHAGDVLTVHTGYIGISCVVPEKYDNCLTFTTLITTTDDAVLEGAFLAQYLNSEIGMSAVQAVTTQGGRQNLNTNDFVKVEIRYPSLAEQSKICAVLSRIDNLITLHQC